MNGPLIPPSITKLTLERTSGVRSARPSPAFGGVGNWRLGNSPSSREERAASDWRLPMRVTVEGADTRAAAMDAEEKLWFELRAHRLVGLGFRRQHPVSGYVVDFVCKTAKLIVEVEGGETSDVRDAVQDARRTSALGRKGFTLLRFSKTDVSQNMRGVLKTITEAARPMLPALPISGKVRGERIGDDR